jgi:protein TorT
MHFLRLATLGASLCCALAAHAADAEKFDPIPVYSIYAPIENDFTADDELASGRVTEDTFAMAAPASKPWRIAFLCPHLKHPYWLGCNYGVVREAQRLGVVVDIIPAEGYDDLVGQLRQMDKAIAARYDAIVISPVSMTANNISIAAADDKGIPVFELANDSSSDRLTTKVTTSLKSMGVSATEWVIRDARRRGLKSVNIALLPGPVDAGWVQGEVEGTLDAAHKADIAVNILDIKYGDSDRILQTQLAAQLLSKHGKQLDYLIGCTGCAPAAILPLQQAGLANKVRVVAYDLTREIAGLIRSGSIVAAADTKGVSQARVAIDSAVNYLEGRTQAPPHAILIKLGLVDAGNIATYPLDTSIAPAEFRPQLTYSPGRKKGATALK